MISIKNLSVELDEFNLNNINLEIKENSFFVLMGPTGAGKSVLLEAIAGLIPIKDGKVIIGKKDVTLLPPEKHQVSIVYQDYSLFPHLTVEENINYGLHFHDIDKVESQMRVNTLVSDLNLFSLMGRYPENLSGGELQRVSLARALVVKPKIVLLDEPLSALDPNFRQELRLMLKKIHQNSKTTFLMVTHDFSEAISLAQSGAILNNGEVVQVGTIDEIFTKPATNFVADFVGMKNIFSVEFKENFAKFNDICIDVGFKTDKKKGFIAIRPEDIILSKKLNSDLENNFEGKVYDIVNMGFIYEIVIDVKGVFFKSLILKGSLIDLEIDEGEYLFLSIKSASIHIF